MEKLKLDNIYFCQNRDVQEYIDVYFETNRGVFQLYGISIGKVSMDELSFKNRLTKLDEIKEKYGKLYIDEVRRTYDNNIYILVSGKWILAIEYILNSISEHSFQEFRFIEDIHSDNKNELDFFIELDIVELPQAN